jgi:hypothetical protein
MQSAVFVCSLARADREIAVAVAQNGIGGRQLAERIAQFPVFVVQTHVVSHRSAGSCRKQRGAWAAWLRQDANFAQP